MKYNMLLCFTRMSGTQLTIMLVFIIAFRVAVNFLISREFCYFDSFRYTCIATLSKIVDKNASPPKMDSQTLTLHLQKLRHYH